MNRPFLSIILPAYNEEERLPGALQAIFSYLEQQKYSAEVLVVENGSTDRTADRAREFCKDHPNLQVIEMKERGKGGAVRRGILSARDDFRFLCDVDLSMPIEQVERFLPPHSTCDIGIASREAPGSRRVSEPYYRHLTGRVFNGLIRILVLHGLQDTQCGFKCFTARAAAELFPCQTLTGWSFDVEILAIAQKRGYRIREIPITWTYHPHSKVSVLRDSWRMFLDLLVIRRNLRRKVYERRPGSAV